MENLKNHLLSLLSIFLLSYPTFGCSDSDVEGLATSRVIVKMTDAPGDYDAVFVEVLDVKIKNSSDPDESGWLSIGNNPGIYNLLDLTGGVTVLLADNEIPAGTIGQIRLVLGTNNTVVKEGQTFPLKTPSAQQSGLKLKVNETLESNQAYSFLIDFDVNQSVVLQAGQSGNYLLQPVLRVTSEAVTGAITGVAKAGEFKVLVSVMVKEEEVSAYTDGNGLFMLQGIPAGTYAVKITPDAESKLAPVTVENVNVTDGKTTDIGVIPLE